MPEHACTDPAVDGWDGSDVFRPSGSGHIVVVDRVAQVLLEAKLALRLDQVGRGYTYSLLTDTDNPLAAQQWRDRLKIQPGDREGEPVCPDLLP